MHLELFYKVIICHHLTTHKLHTYEKNFPTRKKGISFLPKKWILAICLVSIAGNTPATQPPKSGKAYVVSNAHLDTQWLWTVRTSIIDYIPRTIIRT